MCLSVLCLLYYTPYNWLKDIKSLLLSKKGNANIPHDVIESLAATFLPDIRAFFESDEGKKEFEEWKEQQKLKEALDDVGSNHMFEIK